MITLAEFVDEMIEHVAHTRGWSLQEARAWVEQHIAYAREEYREHGAPFGDTDAGFLAWLQPRHQPPAA